MCGGFSPTHNQADWSARCYSQTPASACECAQNERSWPRARAFSCVFASARPPTPPGALPHTVYASWGWNGYNQITNAPTTGSNLVGAAGYDHACAMTGPLPGAKSKSLTA